MNQVKDFPTATAWWHGLNGHIYFSHVDDESERELYEVTVRSFNEPNVPGMIATWAVPVSNEKVIGVCEVRLHESYHVE